MPDFTSYQSPFSWRYGSEAMRTLVGTRKRLLWRRIWVALAETEAEYGLVSAQIADCAGHMDRSTSSVRWRLRPRSDTT
jgi:adenylosuccinate lyase